MTKRKHIFFQGKKYYIHQGYFRTEYPYSLLSHDVWNYYHPNDTILFDEVIHHVDGNSVNDNIDNLQKLKHGKHNRLHMIGVPKSEKHKQNQSKAMKGKLEGENNPMFGIHRFGENSPGWKGGITIDWNKYQRERRWRIKKMKDLIEEILDVFESAIYGEAHNSISPTDAETLRGDYRKELEDIFKEQDKISPEKGD